MAVMPILNLIYMWLHSKAQNYDTFWSIHNVAVILYWCWWLPDWFYHSFLLVICYFLSQLISSLVSRHTAVRQYSLVRWPYAGCLVQMAVPGKFLDECLDNCLNTWISASLIWQYFHVSYISASLVLFRYFMYPYFSNTLLRSDTALWSHNTCTISITTVCKRCEHQYKKKIYTMQI